MLSWLVKSNSDISTGIVEFSEYISESLKGQVPGVTPVSDSETGVPIIKMQSSFFRNTYIKYLDYFDRWQPYQNLKKIQFNTLSLGLGRYDKSLIYMTVVEGGGELRKLEQSVEHKFKVQRSKAFIPHLPICRINGDQSNEALKNIRRIIQNLEEQIDYKKLDFKKSKLVCIESSKNKTLFSKNLS